VQAVLKWPNDLLVADEKVGGVIAEKVNEKIVIGIGINCLQEPSNLPAIGATSLRIHSAEPVNRNLLVAHFLNELDRNIFFVGRKAISGGKPLSPTLLHFGARYTAFCFQMEVR